MNVKVLSLAVIASAALALPAAAHHSFAMFDQTKVVTLNGTVKELEWTNPHIWFYLDVKDDAGKVANWGFSGAPPGVLMRRGITKDSMKIGDTIHVEGFRAKDGSTNGSGGIVTFADGRKVFTASAEDRVPQSERK